MALTDGGVYRIVCAANPAGAVSVTDRWIGCRPVSWDMTEDPLQRWVAVAANGNFALYPAPTPYCMRIANGSAYDGAPLVLDAYYGAKYGSERWEAATDGGTLTINGTSYPTYTLESEQSAGYYATMGPHGTHGVVRKKIADGDGFATSQRFAFVPDVRCDPALTAPPSVSSTLGNPASIGSGNVTPTFKASGGSWAVQCRYRTAQRKAGSNSMGAWSEWKSLYDGSTASYGWGANPQSTGIGLSVKNGTATLSKSVAVDNSADCDRTDVQFSMRQFASSWGENGKPFAGGASVVTVHTARPFAIDSITATRTPDGVIYGWSAPNAKGACSVRVSSNELGFVDVTGSGTGETEVPLESHAKAPSGTTKVTVRIKDADGIVAMKTQDVAVSYEASSGMTISATANVSGAKAVISTAATTQSTAQKQWKAWLVIERGHGTRYIKLAGWTCYPPLGVPYDVVIACTAGSAYAVKKFTFAAIIEKPPAYHVTSRDGSHDLAIACNVGAAPTFQPSYSRSRTQTAVSGRERKLNVYDVGTDASWTLEGALVGDSMAEDAEKVDWFAHADHVLFRNPSGFWAQAGVDKVSIDDSIPNRYRKVSLSFDEEEW